jgi:hypothetical protein
MASDQLSDEQRVLAMIGARTSPSITRIMITVDILEQLLAQPGADGEEQQLAFTLVMARLAAS